MGEGRRKRDSLPHHPRFRGPPPCRYGMSIVQVACSGYDVCRLRRPECATVRGEYEGFRLPDQLSDSPPATGHPTADAALTPPTGGQRRPHR